MIYDCTYSDAVFDRYRTWGHSTWEEGVRIAERNPDFLRQFDDEEIPEKVS